MHVRIKRNTGMTGVISNFNILLDDDKVKTIKNQEIIDLPIPDNGATLQVTQSGAKSQKVQVKDGDELEITTTFLGKYGIFILILVAAIAGLLFNNYVRYSLFIIYMIALIVVDGLMYDLTKTSSGTT